MIDASLRGGALSGTPRLSGEAAGPAVEEAVGTVGGEEAPMTDLIAHAYRVGVSVHPVRNQDLSFFCCWASSARRDVIV